jgi:ribosomal protein L39E
MQDQKSNQDIPVWQMVHFLHRKEQCHKST